MGKISKLLLNALAIASVQAQDFEVTDCSNDNVSTRLTCIFTNYPSIKGIFPFKEAITHWRISLISHVSGEKN